MIRKNVLAMDPGPSIGPIEKRVPLPRARNHAGLRDHMRDLKVGDSFVTAVSRSACHSMARLLGIFIQTRQETESSIRCWRVGSDHDD